MPALEPPHNGIACQTLLWSADDTIEKRARGVEPNRSPIEPWISGIENQNDLPIRIIPTLNTAMLPVLRMVVLLELIGLVLSNFLHRPLLHPSKKVMLTWTRSDRQNG
jgi:hypothetical protein